MDRLKEVLRNLSEATGIVGHEQEVARYVAEIFSPFTAEIKTDRLGNLVALKRGEGGEGRLKVMLTAHMDEIGFLVSSIEDGFLKVSPVGGFDSRTAVNQEVVILGREKVAGVFGSYSPYSALDKGELGKGVTMEQLFIDTGLPHDTLSNQVRVGDLVVINRDFTELAGDVVTGKALDDRAGLAVLYACLEELSTLRHSADVYAVGTVQEEVGYRGAFTATYGIVPDIGIAVDVTHGSLPGVPKYKSSELGKGAVNSLGPNIHPQIYKKLEATAQEHGISSQKEVIPAGSGTDAMAIQITKAGIATGILSIPLRYMHTSVETLDVRDVKSAGRLLAYFIRDIDASFREGLKCC